MQTDAWRDLSGNAVKVLLALVSRDNGTRNGAISFSVREAADTANLSPGWFAVSFCRERPCPVASPASP
jgi:hypothetical protein